MAKENLIGIKTKKSFNPSSLKQYRCATGNNTAVVIVNWQSMILATKTTGV